MTKPPRTSLPNTARKRPMRMLSLSDEEDAALDALVKAYGTSRSRIVAALVLYAMAHPGRAAGMLAWARRSFGK